jgi:acyl-CoA synthetase (AMP-forming)/AMP-acid ligase II/acyl carrier protein
MTVAVSEQVPTARQLLEVIAECAVRDPAAPALLGHSGDVVPYGDLHAKLGKLVAQLRGVGIAGQDRVIVAADHDIAGAGTFLTALAGTVCAPVSQLWSAAELRAYLEIIGPKAVLTDKAQASRVTEVANELGIPVFAVEWAADEVRAVTPSEERDPVVPPSGALDVSPDDALLLRTSGTTTAGKAVAITAAQMLAGARATVRAYQLGPADRRLNAMPLFHVQGLVGSLVASLCAGGSIALLPYFDPRQFLLAMETFSPTWFSGTSTMQRALLDVMPDNFTPPRSIRFVRCGSGALKSSLREEIIRHWRVPVVESYGMTEAHQIASTPLTLAPQVAGMVMTGSTVGVLDGDGGIQLAAGSGPGELVIRGSNVITHYAWPRNLDDRFVGGWLRTGDLGQIAEDGSVLVTGRIKEVINSGGEKFSPLEVETAIAQHPSVRDVVAFAVPDPRYGERAAVIVVPDAGHEVTEKELIEFTVGKIAAVKVPRRILLMEDIPVGGSGKVVRSELAELVPEGPPGSADAPDDGRDGNAVEARLRGIWMAALGRAVVNLDDDFVALGGDSLSAVTLLNMAYELFGVEISPLVLFGEASTIASMADWIENRKAGDDVSAQAPVTVEKLCRQYKLTARPARSRSFTGSCSNESADRAP